MAGLPAMMDAPMIAVTLMCWLLIAAFAAVGIVALVKWLLRRNRP
jgi:hypothetical protein